MLLLALVGVYLVGIAGVVTVGAILGVSQDHLAPLEERLAIARAELPPNTPISRSRVVESIDVR